MVTISGLSTCLPDNYFSQEAASEYASKMPGLSKRQREALRRLYRLTHIKTRASVFADDDHGTTTFASFFPVSTDVMDRGPTTAERMVAYNKFAKELSTRVCLQSLAMASIEAASVTHLVTVSCTGFGSPGFDLNLVEKLALSPDVYRTNVGFMGCHGTMNALRVAQAFLAQDPDAIVLLCATEVCSLHFQYRQNSQDLVANSLFADGAAALVLHDQASDMKRLQYVDSCSHVVPNSEQAMSWTIGDHGFQMTLSADVPRLVEENLPIVLAKFLKKHMLSIDSIKHWAVHPGGPRVLDAVESSLGLNPEALRESRQVLQECGNMSSPTIMFILQRMFAGQTPAGTPTVALAFGPGLTIEVALFR